MSNGVFRSGGLGEEGSGLVEIFGGLGVGGRLGGGLWGCGEEWGGEEHDGKDCGAGRWHGWSPCGDGVSF